MDNFRIKSRAGVKVIECAPLAEAGFIAAFSTRLGGCSQLPNAALNLGHFDADPAENVTENRRRFLAALDLNQTDQPHYEIITVKQVHSAASHLVESLAQAQQARVSCDALLTGAPNLLLGIQTADCLPVLIVDPKRRAIAGAHAGWRGTLARIVEHTVKRLCENFGSQPADCLAACGPAIGRCCFEVGADVIEPFQAEFPYGCDLFWNHQPNGKAHMDLRAANHQQLLSSGLRAENIFMLPDCTRCQMDLYFSYRGESGKGRVGRLLSVVGLA
jgi:YfiH family protein